MKKYTAIYTDEHDTEEFDFTSNHRANSKANYEDCKMLMIRKWGFNRAKNVKIERTYLSDKD